MRAIASFSSSTYRSLYGVYAHAQPARSSVPVDLVAGIALRHWSVLLAFIVHLAARDRPAGNNPHQCFGRQRPGNHLPSSQGWSFSGASIPNRRMSCLPNLPVSPSDAAKPCVVCVLLVSESVWANTGTAAVQTTISANRIFTCGARPNTCPHLRARRSVWSHRASLQINPHSLVVVHRRPLSQRSEEVRQRPPTTPFPWHSRLKNLRYRMRAPSRARSDRCTMAASDPLPVRELWLRLQAPRPEYCRDVVLAFTNQT